MNIDSSNVNTLLSGENLEGIQRVEGEVSTEFSEALMQKIKQLSGTDDGDVLADNIDTITTNNSEGGLQELAGYLNEKGITSDLSSILGKILPTDKKIDQGSDLENTMNMLSNILEKVELIKNNRSEQEEKLDLIIEGLQELKLAVEESLSNNVMGGIRIIDRYNMDEDTLNVGKRVNIDNEQLKKENLSISASLASRLDQVMDKVQQVADSVSEENTLDNLEGSENQIGLIALDVESIKKTVTQKASILLQEKNEATDQLDSRHDKDDSLLIVNEQVSTFTPTDESLKTENIISRSKVIGRGEQEIKQDVFSLKKTIAENTIGISADIEAQDLSQQKNESRKPGQENPFTLFKQNTKLENSVLKDVELNNEKASPKFATELAMLNRAVIAENKTEIPPMTKQFSHPEWNKEMGERVIWMHKQEIPSAELRLNPKHLGPVTIKIDVTQDQATVAFTAQHAVVKEAIEASLPKLREMLSAQQLNLVDVNVSQNDSGQRQAGNSDQMDQGAGDGKNRDSKMINAEQADKQMEIADEIEAGRAISSNGILSIFA
ncbi:MAG: flagellar hook-length control protein FliK [Methylococcaceae bacterium]|nr:flagellar hook-length control protein FliK [Methylococcaceae bacterium]